MYNTAIRVAYATSAPVLPAATLCLEHDNTVVVEDVERETPALRRVHDTLRRVRGSSSLELVEEVLRQLDDYEIVRYGFFTM